MLEKILSYINTLIRFLNSLANALGMGDVLSEVDAENLPF